MKTLSVARSKSTFFTNYVNVPFSINKLDAIHMIFGHLIPKLWLKREDYVNHVTHKTTSIDEKDVHHWSKVDAQVCRL